jgi:hypothetical protein
MAIVRAQDGNYYEIPDEQLAKLKIPADKLKEKIGSQPMTSPGGPGGSPLVNVHIYYSGGGGAPGAAEGAGTGAVRPYDWYWLNWRNWANWQNWNNWQNWRNGW